MGFWRVPGVVNRCQRHVALCPVGELYSTYVRKSMYGSEKHCRPAGFFWAIES